MSRGPYPMPKFCQTYQCICTCRTCEGVPCAKSPKTRAQAEVTRCVTLDEEGKVISAGVVREPGSSERIPLVRFSDAGSVHAPEVIILDQGRDRRRSSFAIPIALLGGIFVLTMGAAFLMNHIAKQLEPPPQIAANAPAEPVAPMPEFVPVVEAPPPAPLPPEIALKPLSQERSPFIPPKVEPVEKARSFLKSGNEILRGGNMEQARVQYAAAIEADPTFLPGYNNLGNVYNDTGEYENALPIYREGLELDPTSPTVNFNTGNALFRAGRYAECVEHLTEVIRQNPHDFEAQLLLGTAHYRLGQFAKAARRFAAVLETKPEHAQAARNLAAAYRRMENHKLAALMVDYANGLERAQR